MNNEAQGSGIAHGAAHLTGAKLITMVLSLLTSMLLSRFRTVEEYGTYSQLLMTINLASSLVMLGLPNCINYFLAKAETPTERQTFLKTYYLTTTVLTAVLGAVLVAGIPWIEAYFSNEKIDSYYYFLLLYPWTTVTISSVAHLLVVYGKTRRLMVFNVTHSAITLLSVLLVKLFGLGFDHYIRALLLGQILITVWVYWQVRQFEPGVHGTFDFGLLKKFLLYSIPIGLASFVGTVTVDIDKLMIGRFLDTEHMAYYTNAGKELPLAIVATSLTAVLMPRAVRLLKQDKPGQAVGLWGESIKLSYLIICFFVTACVVFAPQIMTILYSEKYLPGVSVFRVYALVLLLRVTYFGMMLNASGKTKFILLTSILTMVLNVILNALFYHWMGFIGPAVATFMSIFVVQIIQLIFTSRIVSCSFREVFPWGFCLKNTLLNALWGVAAAWLVHHFKIGTDIKGIGICIGMGAAAAVIYGLLMRKTATKLWRNLNEMDAKNL